MSCDRDPLQNTALKKAYMLRNLCSVATMYRTVLIKDLCNSKRKQEQLSTEMQKCAKTSCKNLPKDIAVLGDPREKALIILLQNS